MPLSILFAVIVLAVGGPAFAMDCERAYKLAVDEQHRPAIDALTECMTKSKPTNADRARYLQARAWSYYRLDNLAEAIADQEQSFTLVAPTEHLEFINYAVMLRAAKRYTDSLRAIEGSEQIDRRRGERSMMTNYHKGWTLQEAGRHREAIAAFTYALPAQPNFPFLFWRRAISQQAQGNVKEAAADMRQFAALYTDEWRKHSTETQRSEYRAMVNQYGIKVAW